jgi:heterodisulfide reductase subunit C
MMEHKLADLRSQQVDALVVSCPSCFLQFDLNQAAALRQPAGAHSGGAPAPATGKRLAGIPVFYITELIALALGHSPAELGLDMHRVGVDAFLEKWAGGLERRGALAERFDLASLQVCAGCRACDADCPVAQVEEDFVPSDIIAKVLAGDLDSVLESPALWRCTDCMTCYELCHSRIGMAEVFEQLKRMAVETGQVPAAVRASYQTFLAEGVLGAGRTSARQKLGLPEPPETGIDELRRVLAAPDAAERAGNEREARQ